MAISWWDIPGPARFVRRVENDLRDRLNIVAALPAGIGRDWFDYFRRRWRNSQERMDIIHATMDAPSPLEELAGRFTTHPVGSATIGMLANEEGFKGRTVAILLDDPTSVQLWMAFLAEYDRECRLIDSFDRTVFLLATDGVLKQVLPASETYLRTHVYEGYARPHDCYMYAWVLLGAEEKQAWRTELKMALCAQLAQWDPRLCKILSGQNIETILCRSTSAKAIPAKQDLGDPADPDVGWAKGIVQRCDGNIIYHSGWVARDAASQEFERRIWTAQVQVVFPLIEQVRRQTIERYADRIQFPVYVGNDEMVNDPYELEISKVRQVVSRIRGVPRTTLRRLDQAYDFRNALAHLRPLSGQQIEAFEPSLNGMDP